MTNKQSYDFLFKVLVIGESGVGKTAIMQRYCNNSFDPVYISTIGVDFKPKITNVKGKKVKIQIWDTAGQERFRNITQQYYRGAQGVLIVYDVTNMSSFNKIKSWFVGLKEKTIDTLPNIFLVGNKTDLQRQSVVTQEKVNELLHELNETTHLTCSAKNGNGIDLIFEELINKMIETKTGPAKTTDKVELAQNQNNNSSCCC